MASHISMYVNTLIWVLLLTFSTRHRFTAKQNGTFCFRTGFLTQLLACESIHNPGANPWFQYYWYVPEIASHISMYVNTLIWVLLLTFSTHHRFTAKQNGTFYFYTGFLTQLLACESIQWCKVLDNVAVCPVEMFASVYFTKSEKFPHRSIFPTVCTYLMMRFWIASFSSWDVLCLQRFI